MYYIIEYICGRFLKDEAKVLLSELDRLNRRRVRGTYKISSHLYDAVRMAEDRSFEQHGGFDLKAIVRAAWTYTRNGNIQGASTIEQQLCRVLRDRYEISLNRKISEIFLAAYISKKFSKIELFESYMEIAYFGWNGNGIREICLRLDISASDMDIDEACYIASLLKVPLPQKPTSAYANRLERRVNYVRKLLNNEKTQ